jgi:TonB family protein
VSDSQPQEPEQAQTAEVRDAGTYVLTDTQGVDFEPYLRPLLKTLKRDWLDLAPPYARDPRMMRGEVSVEFAILKTRKVMGMRLVRGAGDVSLDRAARAAISNSKFPPLPTEYPAPYLDLRFRFVYNPIKPSDLILQYRERSRP